VEIQYKNLKIFGPAVLKVRIPEEITKKLNDYIDEVVKDKGKSKNLNLGESLAGDVTQEFFLENEDKDKREEILIYKKDKLLN